MQGIKLHHENTQNTRKRGAEERKLRETKRDTEKHCSSDDSHEI